jgi:hypothetical protein
VSYLTSGAEELHTPVFICTASHRAAPGRTPQRNASTLPPPDGGGDASAVTGLEVQRVEAAIRRAIASVIEREMPIALAVRIAAAALLQAGPAPTTPPPERPSERCARQNHEGLERMRELEAAGKGRDAAAIVAREQADPRDPSAVYARAQALHRLRPKLCVRRC